MKFCFGDRTTCRTSTGGKQLVGKCFPGQDPRVPGTELDASQQDTPAAKATPRWAVVTSGEPAAQGRDVLLYPAPNKIASEILCPVFTESQNG